MKKYKIVRKNFFALMGSGILDDSTWNTLIEIYHSYHNGHGTMKNWNSDTMLYFRINVNEVLKDATYEV